MLPIDLWPTATEYADLAFAHSFVSMLSRLHGLAPHDVGTPVSPGAPLRSLSDILYLRMLVSAGETSSRAAYVQLISFPLLEDGSLRESTIFRNGLLLYSRFRRGLPLYQCMRVP